MRTKRSTIFATVFGLFIIGQISVSNAYGQKGAPSPIPQPINAKIVNTATEPIPVTGSITASGGVSITNTPTVKIDETANTVVVRSSTEQALFLVFGLGEDRVFSVNTTKFSKVRVCVDQTSWYSRNVTVKSQASGTGFDNFDFIIDSLALHGALDDVTDHKCGVYEAPGKQLVFEIPGTDTSQPGTMRLVVFGNPN